MKQDRNLLTFEQRQEIARKAMETRRARPGTILRRQIEDAARQGFTLDDLTVLSTKRDPYRLDTEKGHSEGRWFRQQLARVLPNGRLHLRGIHYRLMSTSTRKLDGKRYENVDEDWVWLQDSASKAARWLGYVPFDRISDGRNSEAEVFDEYAYRGAFTPRSHDILTLEPSTMPDSISMLPRFLFCGGQVKQPYRIALVGEKASLGDILRPIAQRVRGEMLLPTGESTDTLIYECASRANEDGRPLAVLYVSDFDPSGHQMATSFSRKLQALRDIQFPKLKIEVQDVALTLEQVKDWNLPSTPLKETELRADDWRRKHGREQTEVDAAIALAPDALREALEEAVRPYFDETLEKRQRATYASFEAEMEAWLKTCPAYVTAKQTIEDAAKRVREVVLELRREQDAARKAIATALDADKDSPQAPQQSVEPELEEAPEAVFTSDDDFCTASRKMLARKQLS